MKIKFSLRKSVFISLDPSPIKNNALALLNTDGKVEVNNYDKTNIINILEKFFTNKLSFYIEKIFIEDYESRSPINNFSNNNLNVFIGQIIQLCNQNSIEYQMVKASQHKFLFRECKSKKNKLEKLKQYFEINEKEIKLLDNHKIDALSILLWGIKQRKTRSKKKICYNYNYAQEK